MTIWGLTILDLVALAFFLIAWLGYAPYLTWRNKRTQTVASAMLDHRRAWMHELLGRDVKIADTVIVGHIMSTASFFASTTVIVIGALVGVLVNLGRGAPAEPMTWLPIAQPSPLEVKVVLIIVVAIYAFQSFIWAIRQANFSAVMMGAAPPAGSMNPDLRNRLATSMANIITGVAGSYDNGMRAYFFALGAATWLISPAVFLVATMSVIWLLVHRQTKSRTALSLAEIAIARSEATTLP
jgi:uncharacterized membrane protein